MDDPKKASLEEKRENIQVVVRCRPRIKRESGKSNIIGIAAGTGKVKLSIKRKEKGTTKLKRFEQDFVYDAAYGPETTQRQLYDSTVRPIVEQVLDGFNCTILAYGQTGTGKTYTMEGIGSDDGRLKCTTQSGIIPRAIKHIFETLDQHCSDYTVRVSYLELYNEQIIDLLTTDPTAKPPRIYDSGEDGITVKPLQEEIVRTAEDIQRVMERSANKRRVAETQLNAHSSRSHCLFTIKLHMREATAEGEFLKVGKLNLVDLAGSENVGRSGARNDRLREAGHINKSLLTLARVIKNLTTDSGLPPYRESKLTRLLQESLGGHTKTCMIATISPCSDSYEETMSTLQYAHTAKSIMNLPTVNKILTKELVMKSYANEIEELRRDLEAMRRKDGVYLSEEKFGEMTREIVALGQEVEALQEEVEEGKVKAARQKQEFEEEIREERDAHEKTSASLESLQAEHAEAMETLRRTQRELAEHKLMVADLKQTEAALQQEACQLLDTLEETKADVKRLHQKVEREHQNVEDHIDVAKNVGEKVQDWREESKMAMEAWQHDHSNHLASLDRDTSLMISQSNRCVENLQGSVDDMGKVLSTARQSLLSVVHQSAEEHSSSWKTFQMDQTKHVASVNRVLEALGGDVRQVSARLDACVDEQRNFTKVWMNLVTQMRAEHMEASKGLQAHILGATKEMDALLGQLMDLHNDRTKKMDASMQALLEAQQTSRKKAEADVMRRMTLLVRELFITQDSELSGHVSAVRELVADANVGAISTRATALLSKTQAITAHSNTWMTGTASMCSKVGDETELLRTHMVDGLQSAATEASEAMRATAEQHATSISNLGTVLTHTTKRAASSAQERIEALLEADLPASSEECSAAQAELCATASNGAREMLGIVRSGATAMNGHAAAMRSHAETLVQVRHDAVDALANEVSGRLEDVAETPRTGETPTKRPYPHIAKADLSHSRPWDQVIAPLDVEALALKGHLDDESTPSSPEMDGARARVDASSASSSQSSEASEDCTAASIECESPRETAFSPSSSSTTHGNPPNQRHQQNRARKRASKLSKSTSTLSDRKRGSTTTTSAASTATAGDRSSSRRTRSARDASRPQKMRGEKLSSSEGSRSGAPRSRLRQTKARTARHNRTARGENSSVNRQT